MFSHLQSKLKKIASSSQKASADNAAQKDAPQAQSASLAKRHIIDDYKLSVSTATHIGDSDTQQDRVEVLQHPYDANCLLIVVADGMGGRSGGAMASGHVISTARDILAQFDVAKDDPAAMLEQLVMQAHAVISMLQLSSEFDPHSTLAAHLVMPSGANYWVHSGDSRIYHFRKGRMLARTRDHSHVQKLIDRGEITEAQAIDHPKGHLLSGCLGMNAKTPPFAIYTIEKLRAGEVILSCTDGLWGYFSETELAKIVHQLPPSEACQVLLQGARERAQGDGDNVSMAVMKAVPVRRRRTKKAQAISKALEKNRDAI